MAIVAIMATKKNDPNYKTLRGDVPVNLFKEFRKFAVDHDMDNSQALETLLQERFGTKVTTQQAISA
jgi:hypothetical protein